MLGTMDEDLAWLNLSGRRRHREPWRLRAAASPVQIHRGWRWRADPNMTFHALTTLRRLAAIDLGVKIDIDLDDLQLDGRRPSRSHFRFCRIRYPKERRGSDDAFGYLLYVKLSLIGNEGEFTRRYRLDEPSFPHHSTTDQFFTEARFEAYRSLGEHIGDKLFIRALVGDLPDSKSKPVEVETWFRELRKNPRAGSRCWLLRPFLEDWQPLVEDGPGRTTALAFLEAAWFPHGRDTGQSTVPSSRRLGRRLPTCK